MRWTDSAPEGKEHRDSRADLDVRDTDAYRHHGAHDVVLYALGLPTAMASPRPAEDRDDEPRDHEPLACAAMWSRVPCAPEHVTSKHEPPNRLPRIRALAVLTVATLVLAAFVAAPASAASPPKLKDPHATGEKLATKFLTLLQTKDARGLAAFLDPSFQLQRADGTGATKPEYLANPATVSSFEIGPELTAVQAGDVLTVRWQLEVDVQIDGAQYRTTEAPRLSVFRWDGRQWRMVSHANFNVPA